MVGTVNEISYFDLTNDPAFCQLFFPTYGVLAWYDIYKKQLHRLPGADNLEFIQTDPSWSWDEKYVVFARTETHNEYHEDITDIQTRIEDTDIQTLNRKYPIQFDLYRIPFNHGNGGVAEPLKGASHYYNYAKKYSIQRNSPNFWEESDWHYRRFLKEQPVKAGLFDLYRFFRIAEKSDADFSW
jgi:hypothetical protein